MKLQITILLLASVFAYTNAAAVSAASTGVLALKTAADAAVPAAGLTVGDVMKMICTTDATLEIASVEYKRGTTVIKDLTATSATTASHTYSHTLVAADVGDASSFTCQYKGANANGVVSTAVTAKILAATTTAAPTTTMAGKSGAGSNSPVMAAFLLTIAAMCF